MSSGRLKPHWHEVVVLAAVIAAFAAKAPPDSLSDGPRIAVVFALMTVLIRRRLPVGMVLLVCAPVLGALFALPASGILAVLTFGALDARATGLHAEAASALALGLAVFTITVLGNILVASKALRGLILALENVSRDVRWVAAAGPAMMGLLPMPGGALLSAPIVAELSERLEIDAETKTLANYWFRHVWEFCWFLYPGLIYISTVIPDRSLLALLAAHSPFTALAIVIGVVGILRAIPRSAHAAPDVPRKAASILQALWPIATLVTVVATAGPFVSAGLRIHLVALVAVPVIVLFSLAVRMSLADFLGAARRAVSLQLALIVLGVYVLKAMFETSGAASALPGQFSRLGIPDAAILFSIPFVVGLLAGYTMAAIATTFPLLLSLIDNSTPNIMLAYVGGYLGTLLSPVHLCLVLTREYFDASWKQIYRRLILYVGILAAFAFALYLLWPSPPT
ncbi:MAG: DUF401 family protein [Planctomycetota bacterium]